VKCATWPLFVFAAVLALLGGCEWRNAKAFEQQLHCGMTTEETRLIAERHGSHSFRRAQDEFGWATHAVNEGRTVFWLRFENGLLVRMQQGTEHGLTGMSAAPIRDLCSGAFIGAVRIRISGTARWSNARVSVDGSDVTQLRGAQSMSATVTLDAGTHRVMISKAGLTPVESLFVIGRSDSGDRTLQLK